MARQNWAGAALMSRPAVNTGPFARNIATRSSDAEKSCHACSMACTASSSSGVTTAYMLIAGVVLVLVTLFAPQGIAGELRRRVWRWLP